MKRVILLLAVAMLAVSCNTTQAVANTKKNKSAEVAIKGNWTITNVAYPGSEYIRVNAFDMVSSTCFMDSKWTFVSNNNTGTVLIDRSDCANFNSPITWYVNANDQFVIKFLNAGEKAKKARAGYVLALRNQTATSFDLVDKINVGGNLTDVVYTFTKY